MTLGRLIRLAYFSEEAKPKEQEEIREFALNWLSQSLTKIEDLDLRIREVK